MLCFETSLKKIKLTILCVSVGLLGLGFRGRWPNEALLGAAFFIRVSIPVTTSSHHIRLGSNLKHSCTLVTVRVSDLPAAVSERAVQVQAAILLPVLAQCGFV